MMTVFMRSALGCRLQLHLQRLGQGGQTLLSALARSWAAQANCTRMKKQAGGLVVVLRSFFDIGALLQQEAGNRMHQPRRSGQERVRI